MTDDHTPDRLAIGRLAAGGLVAAAVLAAPSTALAQKDKEKAKDEVDLKDVPEAAVKAAKGLRPKAKWLSVTKVEEGTGKNKKVAYEFDGTDGQDRNVTMLVTAEGKVVEIETTQKDPEKPAKVLAAVQKRWPNFKPTETHHIRIGEDLKKDGEDGDGDHLYDMRGMTGKKGEREFQVQVSADGDILEWTAEVATDKVPKEVMDALKKARPKFEIVTAYALHEPKQVIGYHFAGKGPKGREKTVCVSPDGKQVELVGDDD